MYNALSGPVETNIPVYLEGPYGSVHHFDVYDSVLLFAGMYSVNA